MAQCPSCQFENMPQNQTCVRCGSILPGSHAPVGVEPPRAGRIEKALRLAVVIRTLNRFTGVATNTLDWAWKKSAVLFQLEIRSVDLTILGMFWKGILPGLPQWYVGRKPEDKMFFFGWLILLFLTIVTFGLPISNFLLGLTISWHLASIIDIAIITSVKYSDRIFLVSIMAITTAFLVYVPPSLWSWNHLGVQRVSADAGLLRNGDSLIYTMPWETIKPQVGNLVLYQAPYVEYQFSGNQGDPVIYRLGGPMFDRVLALEGQTVSWQGGTLTIDGALPPYQPFIAVSRPPDTTFVVPAGQCYIVPGVAFSRLRMPATEHDWQAMGLVPSGSIYGVVWGVRRSLFHFVDIHSTQPLNP